MVKLSFSFSKRKKFTVICLITTLVCILKFICLGLGSFDIKTTLSIFNNIYLVVVYAVQSPLFFGFFSGKDCLIYSHVSHIYYLCMQCTNNMYPISLNVRVHYP